MQKGDIKIEDGEFWVCNLVHQTGELYYGKLRFCFDFYDSCCVCHKNTGGMCWHTTEEYNIGNAKRVEQALDFYYQSAKHNLKELAPLYKDQ